MKTEVVFIVLLSVLTLCVVHTPPVKSQNAGFIFIGENVTTSTNETVPIQKDGNVYTFTDDIIDYTLVVQRDSVVIDGAGYILSGEANIGIDLTSINNVEVRNMQLESYIYGIYLFEATGNTISGNTLINNAYALYIVNSSQNTVEGNTFTNNNLGLILESSSNNIARNNSFNNNFNIALYGSQFSHFINDVDTSNTIEGGKKVYYLIGEDNLIINPSTYPDIGFLALVDCNSITVQNLELEKNGQGVIFAYTTNSTVLDSHITNNFNGVGLYGATGNSVYNNQIVSNARGIQISIGSSANSIIINNISDNNDGIYLFDSTTNVIAQNNITNSYIGIGFRSSSNNIIRGNFFIDNERQVFDNSMQDSEVTPSTNVWDSGYQGGGNYWSDYTGIDAMSGPSQDQPGGDGKGDTPYILYGSNQDNFPLLPFGSPPAIVISSPKNKTYTVTSVSLSVYINVPTSRTAYSLDGKAQVEITGDITLEDLDVGSHRVTVYATDQNGLENSATVYFTIAEGAGQPQSEFPIYVVVVVVAVVATAVIAFYFIKIRKKKNYSGVNMQQGHVQTDSDLKE